MIWLQSMTAMGNSLGLKSSNSRLKHACENSYKLTSDDYIPLSFSSFEVGNAIEKVDIHACFSYNENRKRVCR